MRELPIRPTSFEFHHKAYNDQVFTWDHINLTCYWTDANGYKQGVKYGWREALGFIESGAWKLICWHSGTCGECDGLASNDDYLCEECRDRIQMSMV